jgi:hypothetical protein
LQLRDCDDEATYKEILLSDDVFNVLDKVGYRGVASRETLASRDAIVRYTVLNIKYEKLAVIGWYISRVKFFIYDWKLTKPKM